MMQQKLSTFIPTLIMLCAVSGFPGDVEAATLKNIRPTPHGAPADTPLPNISEAIKSAARELGWRVTDETPGALQVSLSLRSHEANVEIGYDAVSFWIEYRDSVNLNFHLDGLKATKRRKKIKGPRIHKNYNGWVTRLAERISAHAKNSPQMRPVVIDPDRLIADELERLDALRQKGALTQDEFDTKKKKLLAP